ncbi:prolyl oligopeptidase family serine peptidase [[Clostridium] dakarense]|uniref:prolyl oligopeptidase family serine peptidase n=1 Tax=Faecalimicrobium dakarense TaxID=1301100 RepID=UPI0004AE28A1|nr:prolyl oligopeptidase family serine peptidase [[Clostridium] dakarense]
MIRKNKFIKISTLMTTCIIGMTMNGCSSTSNDISTLDSSNVTLITKVLPYGEVGYAMVCDFGDTVDASELKPENFKVEVTIDDKTEERTVTKVYTNDEIDLSEESKEGQYVVIELDIEDENASTIVFEEERFLNDRLGTDYTVTQNTDIKTKNGKTFKSSEDKIKKSNIVTPIVDEFEKLTYKDSSGNTMDYRLFEPKTENNEKYPLVLFLHGSGERGSDNEMHMLGNEGALVWADPKQQEKNPTYVLAPQVPAADELTMYWTEEPNYTTMLNLLKETIEKYNIDENRIYVVGMSNGGIGTWNIIEKNPKLFAAAVPICGIGDINGLDLESEYIPMTDYSAFKNIKDMPIWIFHAEDDPLVDVRYSRDAEKAIKELGGTSVKYTEYKEGEVMPMGHFSWVPALQNQEMIDWVFSQSK